MRVVTWNIQIGRPNPDGPPDVDPVVEALRSLDADVHALQELDRGRRRSGGVDQPARIAEGLGGKLVWAPTVRRGAGEYGIAIVVRGEVRHSAVVPLSGTREPRAALIAEVVVAGRPWTVGCTHLSRNTTFAQGQLVQVFEAMAACPAPRVLLGDLNLVPAEVLPSSTAAGYQLLGGLPTHSTRQARLTRHIDHVLLDEAVGSAVTVHRFGISDHCAVSAELSADPG